MWSGTCDAKSEVDPLVVGDIDYGALPPEKRRSKAHIDDCAEVRASSRAPTGRNDLTDPDGIGSRSRQPLAREPLHVR